MTQSSRCCFLAVWAVSCLATATATAQSYQVEASSYGQLEPGAALVIVNASGEADPRFYGEVLVWGGYEYDGGTGDVLVMAVGFRDPERWVDARLGRLMIRAGALRPLHLDGADVRLRIPGDFRLEIFAGIPVEPSFDYESLGWVTGARLSRALGTWGSTGVSYAYMALDGDPADQEVAFDLGAEVTSWLDFNTKISVDLFNPGVAEMLASAVFRKGIWTTDVFYSDRDPSRMLRSNSLFSVLGGFASRRVGASVVSRVAPRLDLNGLAAMRVIDGGVYESILLGGRLRLDDAGKSALGAEIRREGAPGGGWTGIRGTMKLRLSEGWLATTEVEVVVPDEPDARGKVWPWARVGVQWLPTENWRVDVAMQASSDAQHRYIVDGLARLTYRIGAP